MTQEKITFTARTRYASGTNVARCNGFVSSSTNSAEIAARGAAIKALTAYSRAIQRPEVLAWPATIKDNTCGVFTVSFEMDSPATK